MTKISKEFPITSELVNFENDLIKFDNIDINNGIVYFFFVINKVILHETNTDVPTYNRLILREVGLRPEPIELTFFIGNYTTFKISFKLSNQIENKEEDNKETKENKETKDNKETKEEKDNKDKKETNDNKETKETNDKKETKETKDNKETKLTKDNKDNKETKDNEESKPLSLSQILDSNKPISLKDKIKFFSSGSSNSETAPKSILRSGGRKQTETKKNESSNDEKKNINDLRRKTAIAFKDKDDDNNDLKENKKDDNDKKQNFSFWKKRSVPVLEQHVKSDFEAIKDIGDNEFFLRGIHYDTYLSKLKSENKKEYQTGRESFCKGFFIASFPQKNGQVIENSQSFPSPCGHKECSSLPAMQPEIIARYPLQDTKTFELNNLAATICFPTGIKVCYSETNPPMLNDYVTPITTEKGERCYMVTYHFYYKIMNDAYSNSYEMHPLKHHLMKFGDSYLNLSEEEMTENVMAEIQKKLEKSQELGFRDYVYVPYCICLISKYPYVNEMKRCLQCIYTMIINNLKDNSLELNNLIMHLIHSIPIPERETRVKFFIPYFNRYMKLICPKMQDISVMNTNLTNLFKYFSIDYLVIILRLMLFEKRILFVDDDYTRLSLVIDNFISLIYPFQWPHPYIPIMSDQMLQMLLSFIPYINGIHSSFLPLVKKIFEDNEVDSEDEVFIIYISQSKFKLSSALINSNNNKKKYKYLENNVPALPAHMEKDIKNKLKKIKDELDSYVKNNQKTKNLDLSEFDLRIRNTFIEMFVQMFHDYYKYMTFLDNDVVFNKSLFLEKITNANDKKFYNEFIDTQLFQQFCQNIVKDELKYFTTMAMNYDPNKKDSLNLSLTKSLSASNSFKRTITIKFKGEKTYLIKPEYLNIKDENIDDIEKKMEEKYKLEQELDDDGMIVYKERILSELGKIKEENYKNSNCYIYIIPESQKPKEEKPNESKSNDLSKENIIYRALQSLKLKSNKSFEKRDEYGITEKEKDTIKETIKDFTMNIFTSKDMKDDPNLKKDLQNTLNTPFGREFFVSILSKNVTNIILLKANSFQLLGSLIYNSLLFVLNIKESPKLLGQMVILVKSTKYFGKEVKGKTITLWQDYKSKLQGYSKLNQINFWEKWYNMEVKDNKLKKEDALFKICDIMLELELDKSFIKNTLNGLAEKEFGKESEQYKTITENIVDKLVKSKYSSSKKKV